MIATIARIILIAFIILTVGVLLGHTLDPMAGYSLVVDYSAPVCASDLPATPNWQTASQFCYPTQTPEPTPAYTGVCLPEEQILNAEGYVIGCY